MRYTEQIWVLESDKTTIDLFKIIFDARFDTTYITSLKDFENRLSKDAKALPDLLVASISLKDGNFYDYVKNKGRKLENLPFYIISDIDDLEVMRFFYKNGSTGYYLKPINCNELISNIEHVIAKEAIINGANEDQNSGLNKIMRNLTSKEGQILQVLIKSEEYTASREKICTDIWRGLKVHEKTFDVHLCNLRSKLMKIGVKIHSIGQGHYALVDIDKYL